MSEKYTHGHAVAQHPHAGNRGWEVAIGHGLEQICQDATEAKAKRIAACWNACDGIDTSDLKSGSVSIIHKLHDEAAKRVLAQRDELLAALKVFQDQCEMMESANWRKWEELASPEEFERWVKSRATHMRLQAKAAIAKVEGGA